MCPPGPGSVSSTGSHPIQQAAEPAGNTGAGNNRRGSFNGREVAVIDRLKELFRDEANMGIFVMLANRPQVFAEKMETFKTAFPKEKAWSIFVLLKANPKVDVEVMVKLRAAFPHDPLSKISLVLKDSSDEDVDNILELGKLFPDDKAWDIARYMKYNYSPSLQAIKFAKKMLKDATFGEIAQMYRFSNPDIQKIARIKKIFPDDKVDHIACILHFNPDLAFKDLLMLKTKDKIAVRQRDDGTEEKDLDELVQDWKTSGNRASKLRPRNPD